MGFDDEGLARRAVPQNALKPKDLARMITLEHPWHYFAFTIKKKSADIDALQTLQCPFDTDEEGITLRWARSTTRDDKARLYQLALKHYPTYEAKAALCKRPEEVDQEWLYAPIWQRVNNHLGHLGINAHSHQELVEQLGMLRYGHKPRVGDTFAGGGSIPFEAARLGCDVYASDLNPIACMLTWGALNIIGASPERRKEIEQAQKDVAEAVDQEITELGIEHDEYGNRAKAYLYCLEVRCPETGWLVPLAPSWVVSPRSGVVAKLIPNYQEKRFKIDLCYGVSKEELDEATKGTLQNGSLVYSLNGKNYSTRIKTLRGDYLYDSNNTVNRLRRWTKYDFRPKSDDLFQERLYAIQWITKESLEESRKEVFFTPVRPEDLERENQVEQYLAKHFETWQMQGLIPDMPIESGYNTDQPIRERGWSYWHHLFTPRDLLNLALIRKELTKPELAPELCGTLDFCSKLSRWIVRFSSGGGSDFTSNVFSNQALNTLYNWANRSFFDHEFVQNYKNIPISGHTAVLSSEAKEVNKEQDLWITDPPYADAVHYHEITEYFIAWLRKNPPAPFDQWNWDSRRALAIKGSGDDFRRGMVAAYKAMADHMPDNGLQCVMFTHQDTGVWSDMVGIFWAAGLQVVGAWYIATETTSELKKGGYVQGTVTLMLRKRPAGEKQGFKNRVLPAVRQEVERQIQQMLHLNTEVKEKLGEPVFNDSDLQMAGYAAALKVLTGYTHLGGEDVTRFALRPRQKGEVTVVDEIVQQAAEAANSLLVPEGLQRESWQAIRGIQRFYLRMMDMESGTGASKLDNYQNFAKAFRVGDYTSVMASMTANKAQLKTVRGFASHDLSDSTEFGPTPLGRVVIALQQLLKETEPQVVINQLQEDMPDFLESRPLLMDLGNFIS
ncbi:anti-phage-associated DUF1156 domain-containing protein, partial [Endozoicomonas sp. YOMI1]|uniref:anti-phage-associated DUF1156 domain-containing protein n=1 Tax=Endozoicomonas sp. YOMI1 TaxID=2828739 RepID=UPI00214910A3